MSARDDYPNIDDEASKGSREHQRALDEIDRLRAGGGAARPILYPDTWPDESQR